MEIRQSSLCLATDLYEFTMAASYFKLNLNKKATFSLFMRKPPADRSFFISAGLYEALSILESFSFSKEELLYLKSLKMFPEDFLEFLRTFHFEGDVWALPEGTIFFPNEPVLEVTAPLIQAQLVETLIINAINLETMISSKAARCVLAAKNKAVIDFSARRTQGIEAGLKVARSSYIAGFVATSNCLAGKMFGIPVTGTMAHSFVESFDKEEDAFRAFCKLFPNNSVFLVDTYDTIKGTHSAIKVAKEMEKKGKKLIGIRIDSGDLVEMSKKARKLLDEAGLKYVKIFVSGGLDEYKINQLIKEDSPIDAFGVGTKMGVSADAPYLNTVYKMVEIGDRAVAKLSPKKVTWSGKKQIYRCLDEKGFIKRDILGLRDEKVKGAIPLLIPVMEKGKIVHQENLNTIKARASSELESLPNEFKDIEKTPNMEVKPSRGLRELQQQVLKELSA